MATATSQLSGSGNQQIWLSLTYAGYNQAGNYSNWNWELRYYGNGWGSWGGTVYWTLSGFAVSSGGSYHIPQSEAYLTYKRLGYGQFRKYHDSNGRLAAGTLYGHITCSHTSIGNGTVGVSSGTPPRIPKAPGKPPRPTFKSATTNSISFGIKPPSDNGGAAISTYRLQAAKNTAFTQGVVNWNSGASNQVTPALDPGSTYYIRYYAQNSIGSGPWSDVLTATTLPSVAPGMTVTPSISGTSVSIALTPPQGSTSVTKYRVERRPPGGTATTYETTTSPLVIPSMTPGTTFEYRASAFIGTYQSPWTSWVTRTQPKPNTNPGDYFDGSSPASDDLTFRWTGTANSSVSEAVGVGVAGWEAPKQHDHIPNGSSGRALLQRVSGGLFGDHSARVTVVESAQISPILVTSSTSSRLDVAEGGVYVGSYYVNLPRSQRMAAELEFYDSAGDRMDGESVQGDSLVVPGEAWTRVAVTATAPQGAVSAALRVFDVEGDGWSPWLSGESFDLDGMMLTLGALYTYFDGSTPDTQEFSYEWLGAANASTSMRLDSDVEEVDPLADPDCPPIPAAPRPPSIEDSCLDETGSWRRYWAIISEAEVYDWMSVVPTITLQTGDVAARQVRIRFYANPDALDPLDAVGLPVESEQIVSYMPPNTELTLDGVSRRAWASVNGGDSVTAGHLLYGQSGGPATWPTLDCGSAYLVSFDVPLDAPTANLTVEVALTTRMM